MNIFKKSERHKEEIRQSKKVIGFLLALFSVALVGLGIKVAMQTGWPTTMGTVTGSEIQTEVHKAHRSNSNSSNSSSARRWAPPKDRTEYVLKVDYQYSVDGEEFTGRESAGSGLEKDPLETRAQDKYAAGKKVQVAYNPSNKSESTLHPGWGGNFIMIFLLAGGLGFLSFKLITIKKPETIAPEDY